MVAGRDSIGLSLQIFNGYYESRFPLNNQKLRDALSVAYFPHNFELITRNSVCTFNPKSSISRKPKHNTKDSVENFFLLHDVGHHQCIWYGEQNKDAYRDFGHWQLCIYITIARNRVQSNHPAVTLHQLGNNIQWQSTAHLTTKHNYKNKITPNRGWC